MPDVVPCDYDEDPERVRTARSVQRRHGTAADVHELVARRVLAEGATPVLTVPLAVTKRGALVFARRR